MTTLYWTDTGIVTGFQGPAPALTPGATLLHFFLSFADTSQWRRTPENKAPFWIALVLIQHCVAMVMTALTQGLWSTKLQSPIMGTHTPTPPKLWLKSSSCDKVLSVCTSLTAVKSSTKYLAFLAINYKFYWVKWVKYSRLCSIWVLLSFIITTTGEIPFKLYTVMISQSKNQMKLACTE